MRCPSCLNLVTLGSTTDDAILNSEERPEIRVGMRICPNSECGQLVFVAYDYGGMIVSYPPERIDVDRTGIPEPILKTLEEAISCHAAKCYIAAGMMVRKTLEELCEDRQAAGSNLRNRIRSLSDKVVMPTELLNGMDDLRLLGNDAAHVEARTYQQVGKEEVEVSLEFTKEILKAVYQYSELLNRLRNLKKH
jgi:hypothetical protein